MGIYIFVKIQWTRPKKKKNSMDRDFPGGPVIKTLSFHCRGHRFNPGRGTKIPTCCGVGKKKKPSGLFK